jgi:FAD/FMN-containing dehydrogenase
VRSSPTPELGDLARIVGPSNVLTDADVRAGYETDWTRRFRGCASAVVRPTTTEQTAAVVAWCSERGLAVVPQGGNTGLVAGGVPCGLSEGAVVLSLQRLQRLDAVDPLAAQVTAGAGVPLAVLQAHAGATGLDFGVDLAARDTATVGGMVATNAGGVRVLRHGAMRAQVVGVEAVFADGSVVSRLQGLVKDNTGYDLTGLLVGSEGTLGIVTAARLRLVPRLPDRLVVLVAIGSVEEALGVTARLRSSVDGLDAVEAVFGDGLSLVQRQLGLPSPFTASVDEAAVVLLVEWAGRGEPPAALLDVLDPYPSAAATEPAARAALWAYREGMADAIARVGIPHKLDVTLAPGRLAEFIRSVPDTIESVAPGAKAHLFGHLGDGNIHVNVTGAPVDDDSLDDAVLRLVAELGGSISAEHGIGRAKARWLHLTRSPEEIRAFRAIKTALDPNGILNPGVLFA